MHHEPLLQDNTLEEEQSFKSIEEDCIVKFNEQFGMPEWFYGGATYFFALTANFAHWTELYAHHAAGPPPPSDHLSNFVIFLIVTHFLRTVAGVEAIEMVCGGYLVGIGWSLVQENGGSGVNLSAKSIACCWYWYHYFMFGLAGVAIVVGIIFRIRALPENSFSKGIRRPDVQLSIAGITLLAFLAKLAKAKVHVHHWFIGFLLTLAAAGWKSRPGSAVRAFGFGLFLHGAAAWGIAELFMQSSAPLASSTPMPNTTASSTTPMPLEEAHRGVYGIVFAVSLFAGAGLIYFCKKK